MYYITKEIRVSMGRSRGGTGGPMKKIKNIGFLCNTGPYPRNSQKINVQPLRNFVLQIGGVLELF